MILRKKRTSRLLCKGTRQIEQEFIGSHWPRPHGPMSPSFASHMHGPAKQEARQKGFFYDSGSLKLSTKTIMIKLYANWLFIEWRPVYGQVWLRELYVSCQEGAMGQRKHSPQSLFQWEDLCHNPPNQVTSLSFILLNSLMWQAQKWKGSWTGQVFSEHSQRAGSTLEARTAA